jgi:two-component system, NarL family, response regulator DesR
MGAPSEDGRVRVLCVEDNQIVADALRSRVGMDERLQWVGWLPSADGLAGAVEAEQPAVLVLDIDMPGRDPFEALAEVLERHPQVRAVIFSGHVRKALIDRAILSGAWGYVAKDDGAPALMDAIVRVTRGEFVLSPGVEAAVRL